MTRSNHGAWQQLALVSSLLTNGIALKIYVRQGKVPILGSAGM
jgi:hypothetical protein